MQKQPKKKRLNYLKENVALALKDINEGKSIAETSRIYKIPESTLRAKKLGLYAEKKPGPATVLSAEEEKALVNWIIECYDKGFPITKSQLIDSVKSICVNFHRKNPFVDNKPGRCWYTGFTKRNPEVSEKISKNVSYNRDKVSESSLNNWFKQTADYLKNQNLLNLEPNRIFNLCDTGFPIGAIDKNEKQNIVTLFTANAVGDLAPSFILLKDKSLNDDVKNITQEFFYGHSESGTINSGHYYDYIVNIFEPWLIRKNILRPVIIYIDSHSCHMTFHLSNFCIDHGIILIPILPNVIDAVQPLEISLFPLLKEKYRKISKTYCEQFPNTDSKKSDFALVLKETIESINVKTILQSSFENCGLFPFNVKSIDIDTVQDNENNEEFLLNTAIEDTTKEENLQLSIDKLKVLESLLTAKQLDTFKSNSNPFWCGIKEDENLFYIWYKLFNSTKKTMESFKQSNDDIFIHDQSSVYNNAVKEDIVIKVEPIDIINNKLI